MSHRIESCSRPWTGVIQLDAACDPVASSQLGSCPTGNRQATRACVLVPYTPPQYPAQRGLYSYETRGGPLQFIQTFSGPVGSTGLGSGFLVSRDVYVSAEHVAMFWSAAQPVSFRLDLPSANQQCQAVTFSLSCLIEISVRRDFAVARVGCGPNAGAQVGGPGDVFGYLRIRGWRPQSGEPAALIGYPVTNPQSL